MTTQTREEQLHEIAERAFSKHVVVKSGGGRWVIRRAYEDGKGFHSAYSAEIIATDHGQLIVCGDIKSVTFAHGNGTEDMVRWIGGCTDFSYYVSQKACIGSGREVSYSYCAESAKEELKGWRDDRAQAIVDEDDGESVKTDKFIAELNRVIQEEDIATESDSHDVMSDLRREFPREMDDRYEIGNVVSSRVFYAYHAVRKLHFLLDEAGNGSWPEQRTCSRSDSSTSCIAKRCAYCNSPSEGNFSIHHRTTMEGPEVWLCDKHGGQELPTCLKIWSVISSRKMGPEHLIRAAEGRWTRTSP